MTDLFFVDVNLDAGGMTMEYLYQLYSQVRPQLVDELCEIPWGYRRYIIDKCKKKQIFM